jgi:uncharacterized lipoprotein YajG
MKTIEEASSPARVEKGARRRPSVHSSLVAAVAFAALGMNACALTTEKISLGYAPSSRATQVAGAANAGVAVSVTDSRDVRDRVSSKKNGYGMETAAIVANEDVAATVARAVELELRARGFRVGKGSVAVAVEVNKFYNDFKTGFWAGSAEAELVMNAQVKSNGSIVFTKLVSGRGSVPSLQIMNGTNAKTALDGALKDAIQRLVDDPAFLNAVVTAGRT